MPVSIFGVMSMLSSNFWLALYLQEVHHRSALAVAVQLLPQVISAIISNVVAANILHRVNNSLIMAFGAAMYLVANLLLAIQNPLATYWAFIFPSLLTNVMGLDLQFNVTNVSSRAPMKTKPMPNYYIDVRHAIIAIPPAVISWWYLQYVYSFGNDYYFRNVYRSIQFC
jgi:predicted MFS family arabinose efflux permease